MPTTGRKMLPVLFQEPEARLSASQCQTLFRRLLPVRLLPCGSARGSERRQFRTRPTCRAERHNEFVPDKSLVHPRSFAGDVDQKLGAKATRRDDHPSLRRRCVDCVADEAGQSGSEMAPIDGYVASLGIVANIDRDPATAKLGCKNRPKPSRLRRRTTILQQVEHRSSMHRIRSVDRPVTLMGIDNRQQLSAGRPTTHEARPKSV